MIRRCALLTAALLALGAAALPAGTRAWGGTAPTAEDLLAVLHPSALQPSFGEPTQWWPAFPQFNVGVGDRAPGLRFYVVQPFARVGGQQPGRAEFTLLLYDGPAAAATDFRRRLAEQNDAGGIPTNGPALGERVRYFRRQSSQFPTLPYETTVRAQARQFVLRVTVFSPAAYETTQTLARQAAVVLERALALASGQLRASAIPKDIADLLPPAAAAARVGPVLGTAVVPIEAWAVADTSGTPPATRARLRRDGVGALGFRRYGLAADRSQVVETTLFAFASSEAAAAWVRTFRREASREGMLEPGAVGPEAAFTAYGGGFYELQFAAGRFVGDVSCFAPFADTSPACEQAVRSLAEAWYAVLAGAQAKGGTR
ncbi:MAG TPA: hypothetical protein VNN19_12890 [bacterium]|nr:hypothetical protein [bacterium]